MHIFNLRWDGLGYEPSVKGSTSDSLNIATFTMAALLQKKKPSGTRVRTLPAQLKIYCLPGLACLVFLSREEGYLAIDKITATYKTVYLSKFSSSVYKSEKPIM